MLSLLAVCCTAVAGIAAAQTPSARFGLGGGATVPIGDYKDVDKIGWHGLGVVQFGLPASPVDIRVDGMYSRTSHKSPLVGNTQLYGGLASVVYNVGPKVAMARAYVLGGGGVYHIKDGDTKFAFGGGGGVSFGQGQTHGFVEARWVSVRTSVSALNFLPFTAGVTFGK